MLTTLRIKNLALVADLTLELQPGCNVITGETGAGKSIIIGALNLVLGQRADRALIRSGSDQCSVEAVIDVSNLHAPLTAFLEENGLEACQDNQLMLKRIFTSSGTNRQFINGSPTLLSTLATLGEWLVDIHGPHDHQSLLYPLRQLLILDSFGNLQPQREQFAALVRRHSELEVEKAELIVDERTYAQQLELLRFQISDIGNAKLNQDEEAELDQEYRRASNAAKLLQLSQSCARILADEDGALLSQAAVLGNHLQELARTDGGAESLLVLQKEGMSALQELQRELSRYVEHVELDPARLQALEERINLVQSLKRKYGNSLREVIAFGHSAEEKLRNLEERETSLARIIAAMRALEAQLQREGRKLTEERRKAIPHLIKAVNRQLEDLGFAQSQFDVTIETGAETPSALQETQATLYLNGFDRIEFQFAPNPGEPARPLRAIASSGEMARVMLALKTVLAAQDDVPVLIFDEVDANIGGETAQVVGEKMRQISRKHQVICITHLAQVAAQADAHYVVDKSIEAGRTLSRMNLLENRDRVKELARMLGGQSDAALKHAEELLRAKGALS